MLRLSILCGAIVFAQSDPGFPLYSAASIAHAAASESGSYAANTLITIYGVNLSHDTFAVNQSHIGAGNLPLSLGPVRVLLDGVFANVLFVSPRQVNALIPANMGVAPVTVQVVSSGRAGPKVPVRLERSAPGLFELADRFVIATHGNGPLVTEEAPAAPGEVVVLYATGLGPTLPETPANRLATTAARLEDIAKFQVWLDGHPVAREDVLYAGVTPGFAGLYQVNVRLPADAVTDPEIRVGTPDRMSPPGRRLRVR